MVSVSLFVFFVLSHLSLLHSVELQFIATLPVNCDKTPPTIQLGNTTQSMRIKDFLLSDYLTSQKCEFLTKTRITHSNDSSPSFPSECSIIRVPAVKEHSDDLNLTAEFDLEVH
ncbi:hypothetical protein CFP56_022820, partial [Quercus suber]